MDTLFRKFCQYYLTNNNQEELEKLKELAKDNFANIDKKARKFIEKLKEKTNKLGYGTDFESFCELLEFYINQKKHMNDEEKINYLKVLMTLSEIHEINLREELERYVSYKEKDTNDESYNQIFYQFCHYNLSPNNDIEEFNELKKIATENNINFKEMQKHSIMFIEELKVMSERLGYDIENDSFEYIVNDYLLKKSKLSDYDKAKYLKILLYLSEIYGINLREALTKSPNTEETLTISLENIIKNLSNPLDNYEFLEELLTQRYNNGYFEVREISLGSYDLVKENGSSDKEQLQAELAYRLYQIFLDKFNNYAFDDLNEQYINLITEEELNRLSSITEEELTNIIKLINKHESAHYIIKKYKLTDNLYLFIEKSITETMDYEKEHIGIGNNSLFVNSDEQYTIRIYINGPDYETRIILNEYITKCVENNLDYNMKANGDNVDNREGSILYANIYDIQEKITYLNEMLDEFAYLKNKFVEPIYSSGKINNSIYGISHSGVIKNDLSCVKSYNDYFNNICEVAYYRTLSKIILEIVSDEKAKNIINNFIGLINVSFEKTTIKSPIYAEYNNINFELIKDLINQYIPLISSTLNIYISDNERKKSLVEEFKKSILYISNISEGRPKKIKSNIAINSYLEEYIKNN